jgi:hypothetical protein
MDNQKTFLSEDDNLKIEKEMDEIAAELAEEVPDEEVLKEENKGEQEEKESPTEEDSTDSGEDESKEDGELIHSRITKIMNDMPAIGKDGNNTAQHYAYRSIDAILNVLHALLKKHHVFYTPHIVARDRQILDRLDRKTQAKIGSTVLVALDIEYKLYCSDDKSFITVGPIIGEAMDAGDKATAKAMTMALKTMLSQVFCIPFQNALDTDNEEETPRSGDLLKDSS